MNRMSPPAGVQANPIATPGSRVRSSASSSSKRGTPRNDVIRSGVTRTDSPCPSARRRAIFRHTLAISRSRFRTPASRVYPRASRRRASGVNSTSITGSRPCSRACLGTRCRCAMATFSSSVYPASGMISMRSRSAAGTVSITFAVVMKSTRDRSNATSR